MLNVMNKISALHPPLKLCCRMKCSSLFFKIKTWQNTWINSCMAFWNLSTKSQIYLSSKNEEFDKLSLELLMMQTLIVFFKFLSNIMYFLQKDDIMLHFTLLGSSDITGCQCLLSYLLSYLLFCLLGKCYG